MAIVTYVRTIKYVAEILGVQSFSRRSHRDLMAWWRETPLIVVCSTDFCEQHDHGSRAKAQNEAESSRWRASS